MEWTDTGLVLGARRHGEANAILEVMTAQHGRHLGLVRGGFGSRQRPVLQPGNSVRLVWRARLEDHLGHFTVEGETLRAAQMLSSGHALFCLQHLGSLARLLPERDPHPSIHDTLCHIVDGLADAHAAAAAVALFELQILAELGFGLDLSRCAATGTTDDLIYVSPRSGNAVSRVGGEPWRDRLLRLPMFFLDGDTTAASTADIADGFAITGLFLERHVMTPRNATFSEAREAIIRALTKAPATPA